MTLLDDSISYALAAARITGRKNSYVWDNPTESQQVIAYLAGGPRPFVATQMGKHLVALEDARRANYGPPAAPAPTPVPTPNPTPPPSTVLGQALALERPRIGQPPGPTLRPGNTVNAIQTALNSCQLGSIVDCGGATVDLSGGNTLYWNRVGDPAKVTELRNLTTVGGSLAGGLRFGGAGSYFRARNVKATKGAGDGFKMTDTAHHCEWVGCEASDNAAQGWLVTDGALAFQCWDSRAYRNGTTGSNLFHSWYLGAADNQSVLANCYGDSPAAYNLQIQYPGAKNLLVTCCEFYGGPNTRHGGVVLSYGSSNGRLIGLYVHDAPVAVEVYNGDGYANVTGMQVFDSYQLNTAAGFAAGTGVSYTRCKTGAAGPIDPSQFGYVPALDIDGNPRPAQPRAGVHA